MSNATKPRNLAILLVFADELAPHLCAPPFVYASVAAVLDAEVEVHFAARSVRLLVPGVAERLHPGNPGERSVLEFMRDAHEAGARFYACRMALRQYVGADATLIPECDGTRGASEYMGRVLLDDWRTLTF